MLVLFVQICFPTLKWIKPLMLWYNALFCVCFIGIDEDDDDYKDDEDEDDEDEDNEDEDDEDDDDDGNDNDDIGFWWSADSSRSLTMGSVLVLPTAYPWSSLPGLSLGYYQDDHRHHNYHHYHHHYYQFCWPHGHRSQVFLLIIMRIVTITIIISFVDRLSVVITPRIFFPSNMIDISCISDWDLSLHSLSSDRPCFFLFWYKMNTHGMSVVAGYFMTVFQAKAWYRITFNLKPHLFKIFRSWTYFMLPFVSEEYKAHFMAIMMMMIWWLIRERAYDNNIRKILKYFHKQRLWWEHRNILDIAQLHCVEERPPQSFA